jgi:hypothetical protein
VLETPHRQDAVGWFVVAAAQAVAPKRDIETTRVAWVSRLLNWLSGHDIPGGAVSPDALATALGEYVDDPGDYSPAHVKDFVLRTKRQAQSSHRSRYPQSPGDRIKQMLANRGTP